MSFNTAESFVSIMCDALWAAGRKQFVVRLRIRGDFYSENGLPNGEVSADSKWVYLLVDGTSNYRRIWAAILDHPSFNFEGVKWKMTSNHDSCWRTDGLRPITETWFKMRDELEKLVKTNWRFLSDSSPLANELPGIYQINDAVQIWPEHVIPVTIECERSKESTWAYDVVSVKRLIS